MKFARRYGFEPLTVLPPLGGRIEWVVVPGALEDDLPALLGDASEGAVRVHDAQAAPAKPKTRWVNGKMRAPQVQRRESSTGRDDPDHPQSTKYDPPYAWVQIFTK